MKRTIFSPEDIEIFSGYFTESSSLIFAKVKKSYLMAVNDHDSRYYYDKNLQEVEDLPLFIQGIFIFRSNQWECLADEKYLNQRLRPMQKFKNWHKRIQKISFKN